MTNGLTIAHLDALDTDNDDLWTTDGRPTVAAIREATGDTSITREQIDNAIGDRRRDAWLDDQKPVSDQMQVDEANATSAKPQAEMDATDALVETSTNGMTPAPGAETEMFQRMGDTLVPRAEAGDQKPVIRAEGRDEPVELGDDVIVHTSTPVNTLIDNPAKVTRLNPNGTINVHVKLDNGAVREVLGVLNSRPQTPEPWWSWPEK